MASSVGKFFSDWGKVISEGFSDIINGIGEFFENLGTNIANGFNAVGNWFKNLGTNISNGFHSVMEWFGNFFQSLWDFFVGLFVPSDELWAKHTETELEVKETINNKIPFVSFFTDEVDKAFNYIEVTDFLNITIPSYKFNLGIIHFSTPELNFVNVRDVYEPHRMTIRSFLALIVYGLGAVYLVKYFLNYRSYSIYTIFC